MRAWKSSPTWTWLWKTAFQTDDREAAEQYCSKNSIEYEWLDDDTLRTEHVAQGAAAHPITGERFFFNQAHLFHVSSLPSAVASSLIEVFGRGGLPRHARYGDRQEIAAGDLDTVRIAYSANAVSFRWLSGDVLLLDNMQVAHGRRPFKGERRVIAALLDPSSRIAI